MKYDKREGWKYQKEYDGNTKISQDKIIEDDINRSFKDTKGEILHKNKPSVKSRKSSIKFNELCIYQVLVRKLFIKYFCTQVLAWKLFIKYLCAQVKYWLLLLF